MSTTISPQDALIVVDMQNDFMPGGALAVKEGDRIVPVINRLLPCFSTRVFTRDWHPVNHVSFSPTPEYADLSWPPHCVQNTPGAEFHPGLELKYADRVLSKGDRPDREAYSGFQDTDLRAWLLARDVQRVFVAGVATDYCVQSTAEDASRAGFSTFLITDAVKAVDVPAGRGAAALESMRAAGIKPVTSAEVNCGS